MFEAISLGGVRMGGFGIGVGALERRNPLPAGRYWIDVFQPDSAAWQAWLVSNAQNVKIEETEHFAEVDQFPDRDFFIFKVLTPVTWQGPGFPSIADATIKSSTDTRDRPDPTKDPTDVGADLVESLLHPSPTTVAVGTVIFLIAGGGLALYVINRATSTGKRSSQRPEPA